jgi:hypothetical protein
MTRETHDFDGLRLKIIISGGFGVGKTTELLHPETVPVVG